MLRNLSCIQALPCYGTTADAAAAVALSPTLLVQATFSVAKDWTLPPPRRTSRSQSAAGGTPTEARQHDTVEEPAVVLPAVALPAAAVPDSAGGEDSGTTPLPGSGGSRVPGGMALPDTSTTRAPGYGQIGRQPRRSGGGSAGGGAAGL